MFGRQCFCIRIGTLLLFIAGLVPVFCFGVGAYAGFSGRAPWKLGGSIGFLLSAVLFFFMALRILLKNGHPLSEEQIMSLKTHGRKIMTQFKALDRRWNIRINGRSPVVIYSQDAEKNTYHSEDLWFSGEDPSSFDDPAFKAWQILQSIDPQKDYMIPVFINPIRKHEYYMDLAGLVVSI